MAPFAALAADMFYERLFYMAPSLRHLFADDMAVQKRSLMAMLAAAVNGLTDLDTLVPQLMELGARHAGYGVKDSHYKAAGDALIWTLERVLANEFTARGRARLGARLSADRRHDAGRRRRSRHHAGGGISLLGARSSGRKPRAASLRESDPPSASLIIPSSARRSIGNPAATQAFSARSSAAPSKGPFSTPRAMKSAALSGNAGALQRCGNVASARHASSCALACERDHASSARSVKCSGPIR